MPAEIAVNKSELRHLLALGRAVGAVLIVTTPITWWLTGELGVLGITKLTVGGLLLLASLFVHGLGGLGTRFTWRIPRRAYLLIIALLLLGPVNYFASTSHREIDMTAGQLHTLSPQTLEIMQRLAVPVHAYAFWARKDPGYRAMKRRLRRYADMNPKFTYEILEPGSRSDLEDKYKITQNVNDIVVTSGKHSAHSQYGLEEEMTAAILRVSNPTEKVVGFLVGHGERDIDEEGANGFKTFATAIRGDGYEVKKVSWNVGGLSPEGATDNRLKVPDDVSVLVIASGTEPLSNMEVRAIFDYWLSGGRLLLLADSGTDAGAVQMAPFLGITFADDLLVEESPLTRVVGLGAATPLVNVIQSMHPIVERLFDPVVTRTARTLKIADEKRKDGVERGYLLKAGDAAWGETNYQSGALARGPDDITSDLYLAIAVDGYFARSRTEEPKHALAVLVGDSDWASNRLIDKRGNLDFAVNSVHWLAGEQDRITIHTRRRTASLLDMNERQMGILKFLAVEIIPLALILTGFVITADRRSR